MTKTHPQKADGLPDNLATLMIDAVSHPVIMVDGQDFIIYANTDAEQFFGASASLLVKSCLKHFISFDSPLLALVSQARHQQIPVVEYRVDLASVRLTGNRLVDIFVHPVAEKPDWVVILFQKKSIAEKFDRQITQRGAARSVTSLALILAHEIKNPLSGIRGAAQLLEMSASDDDRALTQLIQTETDRIVALVDRMEVFSDERPIERFPVNIHAIFNHVKTLAQNGFARHVRFIEHYDPSLPPVFANRNQLVQVFLNLVKNAAEAIGERKGGTITLATAYRPGMRLCMPGRSDHIALPLEFCVEDNGPGVPDDIKPYLFDPFITNKPKGSGLGLALVVKIINDHGGVVECESVPGRTVLRILMPMWRADDADMNNTRASL